MCSKGIQLSKEAGALFCFFVLFCFVLFFFFFWGGGLFVINRCFNDLPL